jgi:signal transduction histidine kinase
MNMRPRIQWIEWGFVVFLVLVCAILTALQYRWTGEIAQAEMTRLRGNLEEQSQLFCRAFDSELSSACRQFYVTRSEQEDVGLEAACVQRMHEWQSGKPRPMFRTVAIAIYSKEQLQLFALEPGAEKLVPMEWPAHWASMKENLDRSCMKGRGSSSFASSSSGDSSGTKSRSSSMFSDPTGALLEFPLASRHVSYGVYESQWVLFELDVDYIRNTWLPELVGSYLNSGGRASNDVEIKTTTSPVATIYSSHSNTSTDGEQPFTYRFNRQSIFFSRSPPGEDGRWVLETRHSPGALEAVVDGSRQRNFGVALALNGLILAAGVALVRHTRRSRELAEAQMKFVATVSHELRTPLTVIRGAAENLRRGIVHEPDRVEQYSSLIGQHAERLGDLIEQVLEYAGVKRKQSLRRLQPVALTGVLSDAAAAAAPDVQAAKCEIELNVPSSLPPVTGDEAGLRRVFHNLIVNAAKHGGEGGWIGINAAATNGNAPPTVVVQVADHGPGIPEAERSAIFTPFFRGERTNEKQIRGSGLGLSLAREIVECFGGTITVNCSEGGGATFSVKLPVATPAEAT